MESSIPKFENLEALEKYLESLKFQLLNAEFATLNQISGPDNNHHELQKDTARIEDAILQVQNEKLIMNKKSSTDFDSHQSNFELVKQEQNEQIKNKEEASTDSNSEEISTNGLDFVNSSTQTNHTSNNDQEDYTEESHSGEAFSKGHASQASSLKTQGCQTVSEQNGNGLVRPKLIQPIYVVYPNQQVGYIEVDLTDENAMKIISGLLQNKT